jgi:hypothetical protein
MTRVAEISTEKHKRDRLSKMFVFLSQTQLALLPKGVLWQRESLKKKKTNNIILYVPI